MVGNGTPSSDLGRRAAHRRRELGLTVRQVAARARMTPGYVDYVEQHSAIVSPEALRRLSRALEVTSNELLGCRAQTPPGTCSDSPAPELQEITEDECRRLIAPGGVGRVVFLTKDGPAAFPVNYAVVDGAITFRTMGGGELEELSGESVGFEVDRLDEAFSAGWSVMVSGDVRKVRDPEEMRRLHELVKPWAGPGRASCLRIEPRRITGRRISAA